MSEPEELDSLANGEEIGEQPPHADVAKRKLAEEELKKAKGILSESQRIAHLGSFEYLADTQTTVWSEEEYRIYGLDPAGPSPSYEVMLERCIHPEDRALLHDTFTKAMANHSTYELEHRVVRPDGTVRWVHDRANPHCDERGRLLRYVGATLDVTERKETEAALRTQAQQLERSRFAALNLARDANAARQQAEQTAAALTSVNRVLELALRQPSEEELCKACLAVAEGATDSRISFLAEIGADGLLHDLAISNPAWDACKMYDQSGHRKPPGSFPLRGIYGRVLSDGRSLIVNNPAIHPDRHGLPEGHPPLTAFLGVPLKRAGKTVGMIAVGNREGGYRSEERQLLEAIGPAVIEAIDRRRTEYALQRRTEELTALLDALPPSWTSQSESKRRSRYGKTKNGCGCTSKTRP